MSICKVMKEGSESENHSLQPRASKEEYTKRNDVITFVDMNKNHYPTEIPLLKHIVTLMLNN